MSLRSLILLAMVPSTVCSQGPAAGFRVPAGFEVTEFADHTLANDIYCMTVDPQGRIVVSGRGYIRILVDDKNEGRANRAIEVAAEPKNGAMGLLWEGDSLFVTGDGGLRRFRVKDGKTVGPSELIRAMKTGGEHDAHAISRGPDGWLYVLCGNMTGIDKKFAELPTSPIKEPIAGCVIRFTPDLKKSEVVCHGLRNAYGMDWNSEGDLFTWDSDNERCIGLPWYEGTRFYHLIDGGNYGWLSPQIADFWRLPSYFPDVAAPIKDMGRGSPTGVVCYRHAQFPEEYRGGMFLCDWTFGRIHFATLKRKGASYETATKVFLQATGDNGFAPTAAVVHPQTGDLYVSIGGRGTRGAVYRIRYAKGLVDGIAEEAKKLAPPQRTLDFSPAMAKGVRAKFDSTKMEERLWALRMMVRHSGDFADLSTEQAVLANWNSDDRLVGHACVRLLQTLLPRLAKGQQLEMEERASTGQEKLALAHALTTLDPKKAIRMACQFPEPTATNAAHRLHGLRIIQIALGDIGSAKARGTIWEGFTRRGDIPPDSLLEDNSKEFPKEMTCCDPPTGIDPINGSVYLEMLRTGALLERHMPYVRNFYAAYFHSTDPVPLIQFYVATIRMSPRWQHRMAENSAEVFLDFDHQANARHIQRDLNWHLRLFELYDGFAAKAPEVHKLMLARPEFGRPEHIIFTRAKGFHRKQAAGIFLGKIRKDEGYPLNAAIVELLGELPAADVAPLLRERWGKTGAESAMLPILAKSVDVKDRAKFIDGLASPQTATVKVCLDALDRLPTKDDGGESFALIRAFGNLGDKQKDLRDLVLARLRKVTGQELVADKEVWMRWYAGVYPDKAARLTKPDGVDVEAWNKRLATIDWARGDATRGHAVFTKVSCAACHSGSQTVGPDLAGVGQRFSRADLFTAILQPSRDVPERYRSVVVETKDGKQYQGLVIYDAPDSLLLQTGAATTVRIAGDNVAQRQFSPISPMPAGLLDRASDEDIADLYAYLRQKDAPRK